MGKSAVERMNEISLPTAGSGSDQASVWSPELIQALSVSILLFTLAIIGLSTILLWRHKSSPQVILQTFGIITIIGASSFLLVVGYSNDQLTPIIGLFGAIAGYLLGKDAGRGNGQS